MNLIPFILIIVGTLLITSVWYYLYATFAGIPPNLMFNIDVLKMMLTGINEKPLAIFAFSSFAVLISPVVFYFIIRHSESGRNRFGDAKFARMNEIRKYGYLGYEGIIIGQTGIFNKTIFMSDGPKTIAVVAKPRSGKGVSFVITNMLNWQKSALVIDIKKEIYDITSRYRQKHGHEIIVFDPFDDDKQSHSINIFDNINKDPAYLSSEVSEIAYQLMPNGKDKFWDAGGRKIFTGIGMYLLETGQHCSVPAIIEFTEGSENLQDKMLRVIQEHQHELTPYTIGLLRSYAEMEPDSKLVSGYFESFDEHLEVFKSATVRSATDKSDFRIDDLKDTKKTIYLVVKPKKIESLGKLFGVITNQIMFSMTEGKAVQGEKGSVMFMLDEFTALGEMKMLKKGAAFLGGYGVRMCAIYQNHAQLETVYGVQGAKEITGLFHERIHFASSDIDEAKRVSMELGQKTVRGVSRSFNKGSSGRSTSEAGKDLLSPQKLMRLSNKKQIILSAGQRPILCNKLFYYKDCRFKPRLLGPAEGIPTLDISKYIAKSDFKKVDLSDIEPELVLAESEDFS